jgi:hypothetical protein
MRIRIQIQGFDEQKLEKNLQMKFLIIFLIKKIAIYFSLGLHKGRSRYRRSLLPSKETTLHLKP